MNNNDYYQNTKPMKAWIVRKKGVFAAAVVYAETRGAAKSIALTVDCCDGTDFCEIEAIRIPQADKYYKEGNTVLDWFDYDDRLVLIRDCNFVCSEDSYCCDECAECSGKEYCYYYSEEDESNEL